MFICSDVADKTRLIHGKRLNVVALVDVNHCCACETSLPPISHQILIALSISSVCRLCTSSYGGTLPLDIDGCNHSVAGIVLSVRTAVDQSVETWLFCPSDRIGATLDQIQSVTKHLFIQVAIFV